LAVERQEGKVLSTSSPIQLAMGANAKCSYESKVATSQKKGERPAALTVDGMHSVPALVVEVEHGGRRVGSACNTNGAWAEKKPAYLNLRGRSNANVISGEGLGVRRRTRYGGGAGGGARDA
jgi:hypothetical protein